MAKQTFASKTFASKTFASGHWVGVGVDVATLPPGGEVPFAWVYCPGGAAVEVYIGGRGRTVVYVPGGAAVEVAS